MKRILVTGGAGYIGHFVVKQLLEKNYEVIVYDNLSYGDIGIKEFYNIKNFNLIKEDISDYKKLQDACKGINGVIALAAIVGDPACSIDKEYTYKINYEATENLLNSAIDNDVRKFVFASSCSVYGANSGYNYLTENAELNPVSIYAETRIKSEEYLLKHKSEICPVILRLSTVFGYSPRMRFDLAINIMTASAYNDKKINVFGGEQWRPFVHIIDVANAFITALEADNEKVSGEIFNVGSTDSNYQIKEIADIIAEEIPGTYVNQDNSVMDMRNYNVIFDKIHKKLNFKTKYSVRDGVKEIINFLSKNNIDISNEIFSNYKVINKLISRNKFIPFAVPDISEDEVKEVTETLTSGWITTGPKTKLFEEKLSEYFQEPGLNIIPVSSCTAGLHLQLLAANIGKGDEVITTPLTFCATINTILYTGAKPVLVDIEPDSYNIDLKKIEEKITKNTKAIVPVYYAGQMVNVKNLKEIATKYNLLILADAAHAIGARYDNILAGTFEDAASFSFYAIKNMTTGEGGIVVTKNNEWADKIRRLLLHGMNKDAWKRYSNQGSWFYEITDLGYKYNMTDVQSAIGIHQLSKLDTFINIRRVIANKYNKAFNNPDYFIIPKESESVYHTRHLYPLLFKIENLNISRNKIIEILRDNKIGTSVHYVPINHHKYYKDNLEFNNSDFKNTNWFYEREISLPLHTKLKEKDVDRINEIILKIIKENKK